MRADNQAQSGERAFRQMRSEHETNRGHAVHARANVGSDDAVPDFPAQRDRLRAAQQHFCTATGVKRRRARDAVRRDAAEQLAEEPARHGIAAVAIGEVRAQLGATENG